MSQEYEISPCGDLLVYHKEYTLDFIQATIKENGLKGLKIFDHLDPLESLSFLAEYTFLERLEIESVIDHSFSFLNNLERLKEFSIGACQNPKEPIDFSALVNLSTLTINWRKGKIKGIENCKNLKWLTVINYREDSLAFFRNLSNIQRLDIRSSTMATLSGIEQMQSLNEISLGNCKRLESIGNINGLELLKTLRLLSCPNIQDYFLLNHLPVIELLELSNCGKIGSIKFISNFGKLKKLIMLGDTEILDGDILPAKNLEEVVYLHRSSYNYKISNRKYEKVVERNLNKIKRWFK